MGRDSLERKRLAKNYKNIVLMNNQEFDKFNIAVEETNIQLVNEMVATLLFEAQTRRSMI